MSISNWVSGNAFRKDLGSTNAPAFPHEYLVKTLSSSSNSGLLPLGKSSKILEIGSFGANNLRYFWEKGYTNVYGIEVTSSLVEMGQCCASAFFGNQFPSSNICIGHNLSIPFPDNFFDLIVSINTLHYSVGEDVNRALALWKSKLNTNGRLFVETAGPKHDYVLDSVRMSKNTWRWGPKAGFRAGSSAGFFDSPSHLKEVLESHFSFVSMGRITEESRGNTVDFLTGYCSV